jgi:hypothetical protein
VAPQPLSGATTVIHPRAATARLVTAMVMVVHRLFFPERRETRRLGWVVTTTPTAVPPPPYPVPQWLVSSHLILIVGEVTAMSGARHDPFQ